MKSFTIRQQHSKVSTLLVLAASIASVLGANKDQPVDSLKYVDAGVAMTFTNSYYESYRDEALNYLSFILNGLALPDRAVEVNLGQVLPKLVFELKDQKLLSFKIKDPTDTRILAIEGTPYVKIELAGVDVDFEMRYALSSKPDWIKDSGDGTIVIRGLNISMRLVPNLTKKGKLFVHFEAADDGQGISMEDYQVELSGGKTDFAKSFDYVMKEFKDFFKAEVAKLLAAGASNAFDKAINQLFMLDDGLPIYPVNGTDEHVYLNLSLVPTKSGQAVLLNNDTVTLAIDGTFMEKSRLNQPLPYTLPRIPAYLPDQGSVQIIVSEYTILSSILAAQASGILRVEQKGLLSEMINLVFDNFVAVFGLGQKTTFVFSSEMQEDAKQMPKLRITNTSVIANMTTTVRIKNPFNEQLDAIIINGTFGMELKPILKEGFTVAGHIEELNFKISKVQALYRQEKNMDPETVMAAIQPFMESIKMTLNEGYFAKGVKVPLANLETLTEALALTMYDGFLAVHANPHIKPTPPPSTSKLFLSID